MNTHYRATTTRGQFSMQWWLKGSDWCHLCLCTFASSSDPCGRFKVKGLLFVPLWEWRVGLLTPRLHRRLASWLPFAERKDCLWRPKKERAPAHTLQEQKCNFQSDLTLIYLTRKSYWDQRFPFFHGWPGQSSRCSESTQVTQAKR